MWGRDTHYLHPQHELQKIQKIGGYQIRFPTKNTSHRSNNKWGFESPQNHPNTTITVTNKKLDWDNKTETEIRTREKNQRYRTHTQKDIDVSHTNVEDFLKKQHINTSTHYIAYVVGLVYGKSYRKPPYLMVKVPGFHWFPMFPWTNPIFPSMCFLCIDYPCFHIWKNY